MDADARRAVGKTALVVGALGIVFGDIGTSPIYTIQTAFDPSDPHPIQASLQSVYGVVSLIFWSVTLIVTVKYVGLVMNADNEGEGGIMALISQIREIGKEVPGGGALCRHGSIGAPRDHPRLAAAGLPGLHSQLPGSGSADPGRPQCDQRTLLPAHAARGSGPARDPGDRGHGHRLAGGDLRRLLDPHQAAQLGYLPRLRVIHTSEREYGQVYVPLINWLLMGAVLGLVLAFQSSANLAFAYGMAVTGTIVITTILFFVIVRRRWQRPLWLALLGAGLFLAVELAFFGANITKFIHGAWVPLVIGVILFTVMTTWFRGRELVTAERSRVEGPTGLRRRRPEDGS